MGVASALYNYLRNSLAWILQWLWKPKTTSKRAVGDNNDDKPAEEVGEAKTAKWLTDKAKYMSMPLSEKRLLYRCGENYVTLSYIPTWKEYFEENKEWLLKLAAGQLEEVFDIDPSLNEKVSIWRGDITTLEIDVIINSANKSLLGGSGVDGAIHQAAGQSLKEECATLNGCETGEAKVTGGYLLPAKYVIHTVGPIGSGDEELASCYQNSLNIMKQLEKRSVAFPCISTGIYGFPSKRAANIALSTARKFLQENKNLVDRIVFCLYMPADVQLYEVLMQKYFPVCPPDVPPRKQPTTKEHLGMMKSEAPLPGEKAASDSSGEETRKEMVPELKERQTESVPSVKEERDHETKATLPADQERGKFAAHEAASNVVMGPTENGLEMAKKVEDLKSEEEPSGHVEAAENIHQKDVEPNFVAEQDEVRQEVKNPERDVVENESRHLQEKSNVKELNQDHQETKHSQEEVNAEGMNLELKPSQEESTAERMNQEEPKPSQEEGNVEGMKQEPKPSQEEGKSKGINQEPKPSQEEGNVEGMNQEKEPTPSQEEGNVEGMNQEPKPSQEEGKSKGLNQEPKPSQEGKAEGMNQEPKPSQKEDKFEGINQDPKPSEEEGKAEGMNQVPKSSQEEGKFEGMNQEPKPSQEEGKAEGMNQEKEELKPSQEEGKSVGMNQENREHQPSQEEAEMGEVDQENQTGADQLTDSESKEQSDFEQISLTEALNVTTETVGGSDEQENKLDKNQNMPPEAAVTEERVESGAQSPSKI